ncbi:hypothetical protein [Dactylosporangium darangshiense]|uniref:hypothetical protein n=1 Tax=Dactylosporangium darangshiense TaxID=579108 RepID=UPI003633B9B8
MTADTGDERLRGGDLALAEAPAGERELLAADRHERVLLELHGAEHERVQPPPGEVVEAPVREVCGWPSVRGDLDDHGGGASQPQRPGPLQEVVDLGG